jgi:hypothetical protein
MRNLKIRHRYIKFVALNYLMRSNINSTMRLTLIMGVITIAGIFSSAGFVSGQQTLDLKTPGGNEAFGGDSKGSVSIVPKEHTLNIVANMSTPPKEGKVFEGWLADAGGSDYKLSVGEFSKNGTLHFTSTMVNPYSYTQFLVTEEPFEDPDPNAASVIAGAELVSPFGQ